MSDFLEATEGMTPGPWLRTTHNSRFFITDGDDIEICAITINHDDTANSLAIAAAPLLRDAYKAMRHAASWCPNCAQGIVRFNEGHEEPCAVCAPLRAHIARLDALAQKGCA